MNVAVPAAHAAITEHPLSVDALLGRVGGRGAGAVVLFVGAVRDHDAGREGVVRLDYTAHPTALERLQETVADVARREGVLAAAAEHRSGSLRVGDLAVVCAVSAAHRPEAFAGCRALIEAVKAQVPIWKHQQFSDGAAEWVGL